MQVETHIDHNIDESLKKELLSEVAVLISYLGNEYIDQLRALNGKYEVTNRKTVASVKLALNQS